MGQVSDHSNDWDVRDGKAYKTTTQKREQIMASAEQFLVGDFASAPHQDLFPPPLHKIVESFPDNITLMISVAIWGYQSIGHCQRVEAKQRHIMFSSLKKKIKPQRDDTWMSRKPPGVRQESFSDI